MRSRVTAFISIILTQAALTACERNPCPEATKGETVVALDLSLGTCNRAPVAKITPPQRTTKHGVVELDGSQSTDANGDHITYAWRLAKKPAGSDAALEDVGAVTTRFTANTSGDYSVELTVDDGALESAVDERTIRVVNQVPVARAGLDMPSPLGQPAPLDGSASTDPDGDPLEYYWGIKDRPTGSRAELQDAHSARPRLVPDVYGVYTLQLIVSDGEIDSAADVVRIGGGVTGGPPTANPGPRTQAVIGLFTTLDGTRSSDPDGDALSYLWAVDQQPRRTLANATFDDPTLAHPRFMPTKEGTFVVSLVVNDGFFDSAPGTTEIDVVPGGGVIDGPCEPLGCPQFSVCMAGTCVQRGGCGTKTEAGGDTPETHTIELGQPSGTFHFTYNTYVVEDRVLVSYEGRVAFDSGCVGEMGARDLHYSGTETSIIVEIQPNCATGQALGTAWEFQVDCPN